MAKKLYAIVVVLSILLTMAIIPFNAFAEDVTYRFGVKNADRAELDPEAQSASIFNKQGVNNYYAFYSKNNNKGGIINPSELIQCDFGVNGNSYAIKTMVPKKADVDNYLINTWPTIDPEKKAQFWWKIDKLGMTCPAGNMVAVIAFKAPANGEYEINAEFYGGAKDDQGFVSDKADGVSFAAIAPSGTLFQKNTGRDCYKADTAINIGEKTVSLKAGEFVYFTADPNATFDNDLGHWYVKVTHKNATSQGGTGGNGNTSSSGATSSSSSSSEPTNSNSSNSTVNISSQVANTSSDASSDVDASSSKVSDSYEEEEEKDDLSKPSDSKDKDTKKSSKTWIIVLASLVVLGGGGAALWFFVLKDKFAKKENIDE